MNRRNFITASATLCAGATLANTLTTMEAKPARKHSLKKLITVEEHFTIKNISGKVMQYLTKMNGGVPPVSETQRDLMKIVLPDNAIEEVGARRLAYMDKAGISTQVLSYGAGSPQNIADVGLATELCREANETLAKMITTHPTRFAGFALLPVADAEKAAEELAYSVGQLGLKGAMISGTYNGTFFDEPQFLPLFAKAQELGVPIFMHPAIIQKQVADYYFNSSQWSAVAGAMFATAGFGWHADAGIALIRMIISGLFDKLPQLQIISGHWGELVPFYLNRLDDQLQKTINIQHKISDYFKKNIYISPSGFFDINQLIYAVNEIGAERILYACDYPFLIEENAKLFLEEAPLSISDKKKIAYGNVEKLLQIK